MKTTNELLLLGMLAGLPAAALAADGAASLPDISKWECKSCPPVEQGWSGSVDAGIGNVSTKSYKFGEYNGLHQQGTYAIGDAAVRFRGDDAYYWNLNASNLGLDTRSVDAEGGKQGQYKFLFSYDELSHHISEGVKTPFNGTGGASLTLPAGFPATSTATMPLAATLQNVNLNTDRKRVAAGASWLAAKDWEYAAKFTHETRDGMRRSAGAFFTNSMQLVEPVDYVTDQLDASASYTGDRVQAKLAYYGSKFSNGNTALTWQDPFTAIAGETRGQLALAPDNQSHQIQASLGYQFSDKTRASADIAWGRMTQNQGFLASTLNAGLAAPVLPRSSLDGRASTLDANLKLTSAVTEQLRLNATFARNERDNQTPQASYTSVSTDMFLGPLRTNMPYSFSQDRLKLSGDYRFSAQTRASAGYDHERRTRTYQEVASSNEDTFWGKVSTRVEDAVDLSLKLTHGERKGSTYLSAPGVVPAENPLMRKYNMGNRVRDTAALRADIAVTDGVNLGLGAESSNDNYSDTTIGLTNGREQGFNADVSWVISEQTTLHMFTNRQEIRSRQSGSQTFTTPDWTGDSKDIVDTHGLGVKHAAIKDKLDLGADYTFSRSRSTVNVKTGGANAAFPEIRSSLDSIKFYADYRLKDNLSLLGSYWFEHYDAKNWAMDGVAPATMANVLTFGEQAPRYNVRVIRAALRYKF